MPRSHPIACTELDSSGKLVSDPACINSTRSDSSAQPTTTVSPSALQQTSGSLAVIVGSVCVAVAALLLVLSGIISWIFLKRYGQKKKQNITESWAPTK